MFQKICTFFDVVVVVPVHTHTHTGVPISTQWGPQGYFYPIQIAQFGLSHYSKILVQKPAEQTLYESGKISNLVSCVCIVVIVVVAVVAGCECVNLCARGGGCVREVNCDY